MSANDSSSGVLSGSQLISSSLRQHGVTHIFGLIGIPVIEVAQACIDDGVRFIGFRNEQSVGYAAAAWGYLTGRPGVALVVGGPGVIHALSGPHQSTTNAWPMLLLAGSSESHQQSMGAFQELDQVHLMKSLGCKFSARPPSLELFPRTLEKAYRAAWHGRPGPTYVDLPADHIQGKVAREDVFVPKHTDFKVEPRRIFADPKAIEKAVDLLAGAKNPLLVIGKGWATGDFRPQQPPWAQYGRAERQIQQLLESLAVPFLPTPMGKGLVPDDHPHCISAARSTALAGADVVIVLGARLNWILHYGQAPKWSPNVKFIRVDIEPEGIDDNVASTVGLVGDVGAVVEQILTALTNRRLPRILDHQQEWHRLLLSKCHANSQKAIQKSILPPRRGRPSKPLTYQQAFGLIKPLLPRSHFFISEGANTMDVARSIFEVYEPRSRLDAGTQATMGVGMGFAIAASLYAQQEQKLTHAATPKAVVAIVGDSAFGFSAMEVETAARNKLGMLIIVMNNGGVYKGLNAEQYAALPLTSLPPTALLPEVRYEMLAEACGGKGFLVRTAEELVNAVKEGLERQRDGIVTIVNVLMEPGGEKKLEFGWLASTKKQKAKL